jgi:zinc protease
MIGRGRWARRGLAGAMVVAVIVAATGGVVPAQSTTPVTGTTRSTLSNGLTVIVRENPTAPVVAMSLMARTGTLVETPETAGISNFLQLMLVRGTTSRTGTQIIEEADRLGGSIDAYGDADYGEIAATALSRNWLPMLELVADVAQRPSMPEATVAAVRNFLLLQIRNRGDRPFDAGLDRFFAQLFGANPYGWYPLGLKQSVERLDREALLQHYRRFYRGGELVLAVSGQVKGAEVTAQVRRLFGDMPAGGAPPVTQPAAPAPRADRVVVHVQGAQSQVLIGTLAPPFTDADHAALKVMTTVLGGGLAARFFSELRDKQGLAYTTSAQYPMRVRPGFFLAQLGTAPENTERAEEALRAQLDRIQREPITEEELSVAREYLLGTLAMDRRTNARQAWYLASYEQAGVGHDYFDRYTREIKRVTGVDVQRVARRYLGNLHTVVVRPPQ